MTGHAPLGVLGKLAGLRGLEVNRLRAQINGQRHLCQRYRNNITGLTRLCSFGAPTVTALQRHNQQQYKAALHRLIGLQRRELEFAEANLARIHSLLLAAWRSEQVLTRFIESRLRECQQSLARQEQKLQDGLAAQAWWRAHAGYLA